MRIITVCGLGVGSSLILKMTVDKAMTELGVKCNIEHWDMGTIKGKEFDLIVSTEDLRSTFPIQANNIIFVKNIVDLKEVKGKLAEFLNK